MIILDENIIKDQRALLRTWRIPARQLGHDIGPLGLQDEAIIPFLLQLQRPTFFSRDLGFYDRNLCHPRYSLVCLAVDKYEAAVFIRRVLRHRLCNTKVKRMGAVLRASHHGLAVWRLHAVDDVFLGWGE